MSDQGNVDPRLLRDRVAELEQKIAELTSAASTARTEADSLRNASVVVADGSADAGRAIQSIMTELRRVVPYDSASLQELRGSRLVIIAGVGFADLDVILGESFDVDNADSPNGEVVHRRRAIVVADTEQFRAFRRGLHVGAGIRSWLGVPLIYRNELIGIIALDKAEAAFYTPEHQRLAMAFASMLATAMAQRNESEAASA